ncbi:MAG: chitobiase/beta-hexosaminidase C-terminal domain-containing protein [Oscillospiraceae bacterium]
MISALAAAAILAVPLFSAAAEEPAVPFFSIESGTYSAPQVVAINHGEGHEVYYTLDGDKPTAEDKLYEGYPLIIRTNTVIRTATYCEGELIERDKLTVNIRTAAPAASVSGGEYAESFTVELTCADETAEIYYTTDGTAPTQESKRYKKAIKIKESCTLRFASFGEDRKRSAIVEERYEINSAVYSDSRRQTLFELVNETRAEYGLAPLKELPLLSELAQQRAAESSTYFSHWRANGTKWDSLLAANGLKRSVRAENLAYYYTTAKQALNCWMSDPWHRANILNPDAKYIGIGCYYNGYTYYWSQLFIGE